MLCGVEPGNVKIDDYSCENMKLVEKKAPDASKSVCYFNEGGACEELYSRKRISSNQQPEMKECTEAICTTLGV